MQVINLRLQIYDSMEETAMEGFLHIQNLGNN